MYQPGFMRALAVVWFGLAVIFTVEVLVRGDAPQAVRQVVVLAALTAVVYVLCWRPAVVVDDDAVTLVNLVRDVRVPWHRLEGIETRFAMALLTERGTFTSWAAPAPGRFGAGVSRSDVAMQRAVRRDADDSGIRASMSPSSDSGAASLMVEQRRQLRAEATRPVGEDVAVRWRLPLVLLMLASVAAMTAVALL